LTAFASTFTPRNMRARASSEKRISLAAMIYFLEFLLLRLIVIPAKAGLQFCSG
jgi:hypothetical protein